MNLICLNGQKYVTIKLYMYTEKKINRSFQILYPPPLPNLNPPVALPLIKIWFFITQKPIFRFYLPENYMFSYNQNNKHGNTQSPCPPILLWELRYMYFQLCCVCILFWLLFSAQISCIKVLLRSIF